MATGMWELELPFQHPIIIAAFAIYARGLMNVVCNGWDKVETCSYVQGKQSKLNRFYWQTEEKEWAGIMEKTKTKNKVQLIRKPRVVQKRVF